MQSSSANRGHGMFAAGLVLLGFVATAPAYAGRHCEERVLNAPSTAQAFDAALNLKAWLDAHEPRVAIVARRGQDLSKYKVTYSHAAYVLRNQDSGWTVLHDLNKCGSAESNLFEQGLAEFFGDDLYSTDVAIVVPSSEVQDALLRVLSAPERFRMHETHYSAVAYPFATKYQNSNGWLIETFARAVSRDDLRTRQRAQERLKLLAYEPTTLNLGPLTRLGGRMFKANVAFDDHPGSLRWSDRIVANTGDDVVRFTSKWGVPAADCTPGDFGPAVCALAAPKTPSH